jgi:hypothetical protein
MLIWRFKVRNALGHLLCGGTTDTESPDAADSHMPMYTTLLFFYAYGNLRQNHLTRHDLAQSST